MPIVDVVGIGPVELPDGMSKDEMAAALDKLPMPKFKPTAQDAGNVINSDVPTVVGTRPNAVNPQPVERPRTMLDRVKAAYEIPTALAASAVTEPLSQLYGIARSIPEAISTGQAPAPIGQQYAKQAAEALRYKPSSPVSQDVLQSVGDVLTEAKVPLYTPMGGVLPGMAQAAKPARLQVSNILRDEANLIKESATPPIQNAIQAARPVVEQARDMAQPVVNRMAEALRSKPKLDVDELAKNAPSMEDLSARSTALFNIAKESGVELNPNYFANMMKSVGKDLRAEGYDARLMPKVAVALEEMQNAKIPKDFQELKTLRKFVQNAQKSADPDERRVASILKAEFDDYVANIPDSSVIGGDKLGLRAWKEARDTYARMSKSEIFTDMLEAAELDKTKFSMSGAENSLATQLRNLAKNEKKMRLFTPLEQEAIRQAAQGGNIQNMLRIIGKFAPNSAVSSIPALLTTSISGPLGLGLTAGAYGARYGATKMRKRDVEKLAEVMRASKKPIDGE